MPENLAANQVSMSFIATDGVKEEEEALFLDLGWLWFGERDVETKRRRGGDGALGIAEWHEDGGMVFSSFF